MLNTFSKFRTCENGFYKTMVLGACNFEKIKFLSKWTLINRRKWSLLVLLKFIPLKFLIICFYRTLQNFDVYWKKCSMEGDEVGISVKFQTENLCFCLRWKLNKTQAAQTKNINNAIFKHIIIAGPIPKVKKSALKKSVLLYIQNSPSKARV